jgi:hypothetical protein
MGLRGVLLGMFLIGCGAAGEGAAEHVLVSAENPATPMSAPMRFVLAVDAELASEGVAAADLWTEATGGMFAPEVVIGDVPGAAFRIELVDTIPSCGEATEHLTGCTDFSRGVIQVSRTNPVERRTATVLHELGHALGLQDAREGLMNPRRGQAEREHPCVDATTLETLKINVGMSGSEVCL